VVTTPEGALLLTREICCPPCTFCWRFVWKVPVFWLKESWLWKEFGEAEFLFCSKVREGLLRVKPSNSASKSNVPCVAGLAGAWVGLGAILTGAGLTGAAWADG